MYESRLPLRSSLRRQSPHGVVLRPGIWLAVYACASDMPYTFVFTTEVNEQFMPKQPGGINGGTYPRGDEGGSRSPVLVIEVESCASKLDEVVAKGGERVARPSRDSRHGRVCSSQGHRRQHHRLVAATPLIRLFSPRLFEQRCWTHQKYFTRKLIEFRSTGTLARPCD